MPNLFFAILVAFICVVSIAPAQEKTMHNQDAVEVNSKALIVDIVRCCG